MQKELNDEQLNKLSRDKKNVVYHWKDRDPLPRSQVLSLVEIEDKVTRLYALFSKLRVETIQKQGVMGPKRWKYIKDYILKQEEWKSFDYTHPLIFDRIVNLETTDKEIQSIMIMISLKAQQDAGEISDGKKLLTQHLLQTYGMTPAEWDAKNLKDGITSSTPVFLEV